MHFLAKNQPKVHKKAAQNDFKKIAMKTAKANGKTVINIVQAEG